MPIQEKETKREWDCQRRTNPRSLGRSSRFARNYQHDNIMKHRRGGGGAGGRQRQRQRQRRRDLSRVVPPTLDLSFVIPISVAKKFPRSWIVHTSVKALLLHLFFARGLVPVLSSDLLKQYDESRMSHVIMRNGREEYPPKPVRLDPKDRKAYRCARNLRTLLSDWEDLMMPENSNAAEPTLSFSSEIDCILLSFGPSSTRPFENFIIDVSGLADMYQAAHDDNNEREGPSLMHAHQLSRRLVLHFLNETNRDVSPDRSDSVSTLENPSKGASSYQVSMSIRIKSAEVLQSLLLRKDHDDIVGSANNPDRDDRFPVWQRLRRRHDFSVAKIRQRMQSGGTMASRGLLSRIDLETQAMSPPNVFSGGVPELKSAENSDGEEIWLSLPQTVKGFRL